MTSDEGADLGTAGAAPGAVSSPSVDSLLGAGSGPSGRTADSGAAPRPDGTGTRLDAAHRAAGWVFVAGEAVALVFYLWVGRGLWFNGDEWDFLTNRSAGSLHDLFTSHSQHWSTLPILSYRFWWQVVGLRSYWPYFASVVVLHLTVAALLRVVMRRSGVSSWVATIAALVFAFFGSGYFNILYGFQIGFCGALVFGLLYLLAAGHDGPFDRRDLLALLAGLASLMCSGVGVTMVVVVVVSVLIRRGWRAALVHALVLGGVYLAWFAWIGHQGYPATASAAQTLHFAVTVVAGTFSALGYVPVVGVLLAALLVVGGALAWHEATPDRRRRQLADPLALLVGGAVFALVTGTGRGAPPVGLGTPPLAASRYIHVIAALIIPALAVAADAVVARWRIAAPFVVAVLLIGVPGNINAAVTHGDQSRSIAAFFRPYILTLPRLPVAAVLPSDVHPDMYFDPVMTMGWLRAGVASGRIPPPPRTVTPRDRATWTLQLALQPAMHPAPSCRSQTLPALVSLRAGDTLSVGRGVRATLEEPSHASSAPRLLGGYGPDSRYLAYQDLLLAMTPAAGTRSITICAHTAA